MKSTDASVASPSTAMRSTACPRWSATTSRGAGGPDTAQADAVPS